MTNEEFNRELDRRVAAIQASGRCVGDETIRALKNEASRRPDGER